MRLPIRSLLAVALAAISLSACAQAPSPSGAKAAAAASVKPRAGTPDARAIEAVRSLNPRAVVDQVGAAPLPGFREVIVDGQVAYASDDGRYLFAPGAGGALYDTRGAENLTEASLSRIRRGLLAKIPVSERIVFAPANPKHRVTVFTDISCGYCQKMHSEIAEYNRQGIAVEYVAFPRMGLGSPDHQKMISVWCAPDRRKALTDAKNGRAVPARDCRNTITQQHDIGRRAGLQGTPMVIAADGTQLGGYLPPAQLRKALDELKPARAGG
ncbi:thioredoxin fold domain-containing protein [Lysobacter humi (ex Lee et al. 2017)]